jgi:hypothetical protein
MISGADTAATSNKSIRISRFMLCHLDAIIREGEDIQIMLDACQFAPQGCAAIAPCVVVKFGDEIRA